MEQPQAKPKEFVLIRKDTEGRVIKIPVPSGADPIDFLQSHIPLVGDSSSHNPHEDASFRIQEVTEDQTGTP